MVESGMEEGGPNKPARSPGYSLAGSPRNLLLPRTLCAVIVVLLNELDDTPSPVRVELRCALAAIKRAYRLGQWVSDVELAWEHADEDTQISQGP